jgi:hypothetical protein
MNVTATQDGFAATVTMTGVAPDVNQKVLVTRHTLDGVALIATLSPNQSGTLTWVDADLPLNEPVYYTARQGNGPLAESAGVSIESVRGWLQSAVAPSLYKVPMTVVDDMDLDWEQAGTIHTVIGSRLPLPVTDVRLVRRGTLRLYVETYTEWALLRSCLDTGHTITVRPCDRKIIENGNLYVQSVKSGWAARPGGSRIVDLVYQQVHPVTEPDIALGAWTFQELLDAYPASVNPAVESGGFDKVRKDYNVVDGFLRLLLHTPTGPVQFPAPDPDVRIGW